MKQRFLIGGGGHARSLLAASGEGFFSGYFAPVAAENNPLPYMGPDDRVRAQGREVELLLGLGETGKCNPEEGLRASLIRMFSDCEFCTLVSPDAFVATDVVLGAGCAVLHKAVVNTGARLGRHCLVNTAAVVEHDCRLGVNVQVAPGAVVSGAVSISDHVFIGAGAVLRERISVCSGVVIAMGSVVVKDIEEPGIYCGVPAQKKKSW